MRIKKKNELLLNWKLHTGIFSVFQCYYTTGIFITTPPPPPNKRPGRVHILYAYTTRWRSQNPVRDGVSQGGTTTGPFFRATINRNRLPSTGYGRRAPDGGKGNRGTRGFIFLWPRFNFVALIWLRVFVRVSNDLQRAAAAAAAASEPGAIHAAAAAPCCFSHLLVFSFFFFHRHHTPLRPSRTPSMNKKKNSIFFCYCSTLYINIRVYVKHSRYNKNAYLHLKTLKSRRQHLARKK